MNEEKNTIKLFEKILMIFGTEIRNWINRINCQRGIIVGRDDGFNFTKENFQCIK